MSRLQVLAVLFRAFGLYLFADFGTYIVPLYGTLANGVAIPDHLLGIALAISALKWVGALCLIIFPVRIVKMLAPGAVDADEEVGAFGTHDFSLIVFAGLGLYFLVPAITSLLSPFLMMVSLGQIFDIYGDWNSLISYVVIPLIHLCVGIWLLLGAKGLLGMITRLRTLGH